MNPELREICRITILLVARRAPVGLSLQFADVALRARRIQIGDQELKDEIAYLVDKGLLALVDKKVSPENQAWRVTAEGRDYLASEGHE